MKNKEFVDILNYNKGLLLMFILFLQLERRREKTCLRGFRPGPPKTGLYSYRRWLEARDFGFRKKWDCSENKGTDQLHG